MALWETGLVDLYADRQAQFDWNFDIPGDLSAAIFKMQVRDRKDGGAIRADLATVVTDIQGLRMLGTATVDGLIRTLFKARIDKATMQAMAVATEVGNDGQIWYDIHITPTGGVEFVAFAGKFIVKAGVTV